MQAPSFKEDHISQLPALLMLQKLGYTYLSQDEVMQMRAGKTTTILLEDILRKQLKEINSIRVSASRTSVFSDGNIENGIQALRDYPMQEGYIAACEYIYNLVTLGKALEQSIDGDKKSFTLQYIDWLNLSNNVFHVTEEYSVMRSGSNEHYRPDIILFINGIPFCIIECKRPDMKEPLQQAISQHLRNQQEDGIRPLYVYAQMIMALATNQAAFATNGTPEKFWSKWEEKHTDNQSKRNFERELHALKNKELEAEQNDRLFKDRYLYVKNYFAALGQEDQLPTRQDEYLWCLCKPERLLDLTYNFIVFDEGEKKIARYQQYFAIKKTMKRITAIEGGKRKGGVIWHSQGSGKSLTMVMLAQAIAMEKSILNPKIILVTDRVDLDSQITGTFQKCGKVVNNATTGQKLVELLESKSDAVVTTIINKFEAAVKKATHPYDSHDIFVLVDEGHRTQYGSFNIQMQKTLPNACFLAFTGTPLMKKEKSTAAKFGGIIDPYPVDQAVKDGAVVPILYEGRNAIQKVHEYAIDNYFSIISEPLNDYQRADLKKKFSRADQLNIADQKIYAISWDVSIHFRDNWQGTGFKGQLVCQSKDAAIKYKTYLDEIGIVNTEVVISPPDEREGEDSAYSKSSDRVKQFWAKMMSEHGTQKKYEKNIIARYKKQEIPEIIIVVDKLLTGFDAPVDTVLYITRSLREHTLLQAICRVNRVHPGKEFGYVIDYYGILGELDTALSVYSSFEDFDKEDIEGTLTRISEEIKKLPQKHAVLWDIFKTIANKKDVEAFETLLRDQSIRDEFYSKQSDYSLLLKIALSSIQFHRETDEKLIRKYKEDAAFFLKLRASVTQRYSDSIDYRQYEDQIQKLIDKHIESDEVKIITEMVNIFETEKFQEEIEKTLGEAAKADKIASRTAKHIHEKMDEDPAFYKKFSRMLQEAIDAYLEKRLTETEYLHRAKEIMDSVLSHTDSEIPEELQGNDVAKAFYGLSNESLNEAIQDETSRKSIAAASAMAVDDIIHDIIFDGDKSIIDWYYKSTLLGRLKIAIEDYLIDEVRDKYEVELSFDDIDILIEKYLDIAKLKYR